MADAPQFPIVMSAAGAVPTPPATLRATLVALIETYSPGFTSELPYSMVEDIVSTGVGMLVVMDQARVDLINSVSPYGANLFILTELGGMYGVLQGQDTNTAVYIEFDCNSPGFPIPPGFLVGDGTHQYAVGDGGTIIPTSGTSTLVYCVATTAGSWAVPQNSVTTVVSSLPPGVTLTCTNPQAGSPSQGPQSSDDYRAQVFQAGHATSQGVEDYLKAQLQNVPGVTQRLISVQQVSGVGWRILVGGTGDPYQIGNAIYQSGVLIPFLQPSAINITAITKANPGVVTTGIAHELTTGQNNVYIAGVVGMTGANGGPYTVAVIDDYTFSFGVNTTSFGTYTSGGVVTPNSRNVSVNINSYPDTYTILFVNPPPQTVQIGLTWNTTATTLVPAAAVAQLGGAPLAAYVNSVYAGQPLNLFEMEAVFQAAVAPLIPTPLLSRFVWTITIDGSIVAPASGTGLVYGDSQSYFETSVSLINITQG